MRASAVTQPVKVDKQPAALKNLQSAFGKAQREEEKEQRDIKKKAGKPYAFKGSHSGAAQMVQRGGRGNRQKKGGNGGGAPSVYGAQTGGAAGPAAVLDLQGKANKAIEARAKEEYQLLKRKRIAYFDAVKRANRPSTVTMTPELRGQLEHALGLEGGEEGEMSSGGSARAVSLREALPGEVSVYLSSYLPEQQQQQRQQQQEEEEEDGGTYYLPW